MWRVDLPAETLFLILSSLWVGSFATCKENLQNTLQLNDLEGNITYKDDFKHADCSYVFPNVSLTQYNIFLLYVKSIDMVWEAQGKSGCAADVIVADNKFCRMPKERCFVYYSAESSCSWDKLKDYLANATPPCVNTSFTQVESYPSRVRIKSSDTKYKTVSFEYKFIECTERRTKGTTDSSITTTGIKNPTDGTNTDANLPCSNKSRLVSTASLCNTSVVIAIILGILLVLTYAYFGYQHFRRKQSRRKGENLESKDATTREETSQLSI